MNTAEVNYTVIEKELLSIVFACLKFCTYIYGRNTTVLTDHKALCHLNTCKLLHGRITRWILSLQDYNLSIEHVLRYPGTSGKGVSDSIFQGTYEARIRIEIVARALRLFNMCTDESTSQEMQRIMGHLLATEPLEILCVDLFGPLP
ncbi:hypothetical protein PR048_011005 [Dryococelus australis]|uniref:Reverse transcriptase RNase H-like domain-containing protein n=1 Tax=Dryococelus australis TaxID=614101 RepID=A0ABQ9HKD7_9NEOP|nr:hypothetical protein PR048_011005 [Dryococelus australis]